MKIEVTCSWSDGTLSETVSASLDMTWVEPFDAEVVAEYVYWLKQVLSPDDPAETERQVNVFVDGVKSSVWRAENNAAAFSGQPV